MTSRFQEFQNRLAVIEGRKRDIKAQLNKLDGEVYSLQASYEEAELVCDPKAADIMAELKAKQDVRAGLERQLQAVDRPASVFQEVIKSGNSDIKRLAEAIHTENREAIAHLQTEYDAKADELKGLQSRYLALVAEMGAIRRNSELLAGEVNEVRAFVTGAEQLYTSPVNTGVSEIRPEGVIFLDSKIREAFKGGMQA